MVSFGEEVKVDKFEGPSVDEGEFALERMFQRICHGMDITMRMRLCFLSAW